MPKGVTLVHILPTYIAFILMVGNFFIKYTIIITTNNIGSGMLYVFLSLSVISFHTHQKASDQAAIGLPI